MHIQTLENLSALEIKTGSNALREKINRELTEFEHYTVKINESIISLPNYLHKALSDIKNKHISFYRAAIEEQREKHRQKKKLEDDNLNLINSLLKRTKPDQSLDNYNVYNAILLLENYWHRLKETNDSVELKHIRDLEESIAAKATDEKVKTIVQEFIQNVEKSVVLNYASVNRQAFLQTTSERFVEVADKAITAITEKSKSRQRELRIQLLLFITCSLVLTILFWYLSRKYLHTFLDSQKDAIDSIQAGLYDYPIENVPDDELGDMMLFIKRLSLDFGNTLSSLVDSEKKYRQLIGQPLN